MDVRVAIEPSGPTRATRAHTADGDATERLRRRVTAAVRDGGGRVVGLADANALMWLDIGDAAPLERILDTHPGLRWVQLPWAGVEGFAAAGLFERPATFTCAKAAFGPIVGEHALMLVLASLRNVVRQARRRHWYETQPESLAGKRVTVLGAGGIATRLVTLLRAAQCHVTVLRRSEVDFPGADRTFTLERLHDVLPDTDVLVLALALTPQTRGVIGAKELGLLPRGAVVVNVARGGHVDTDALVEALASGHLAAAGLDVTDPEPLPDSHPLWTMDNVLVTSHCADSASYVTAKLAERVAVNVARFAAGQPLEGVVDPVAGY